MYDPERGTIRWDGVDLRDMRPEELRHRIGTVFQDYMAYDLTARENIALGDLSTPLDEDRVNNQPRGTGLPSGPPPSGRDVEGRIVGPSYPIERTTTPRMCSPG